MNKKLYVGNLPFECTEEELRNLFSAHGRVVSVRIITDYYTGRSKGFGFVEMESDEASKAAIAALNKHKIGDREILVDEARPPKERNNRGGGEGRGPRRFGSDGGRERHRY